MSLGGGEAQAGIETTTIALRKPHAPPRTDYGRKIDMCLRPNSCRTRCRVSLAVIVWLLRRARDQFERN
jgi:hypothetical protein